MSEQPRRLGPGETAYLQIEQSPDDADLDQAIVVVDHSIYKIGRRFCAFPNLGFVSQNVSRITCAIVRDESGGFSISDYGSTNGTFVNDTRVDKNHPLAPGDVIVIGRTDWEPARGREIRLRFRTALTPADPAPLTGSLHQHVIPRPDRTGKAQ